jgi:hypothetical protein
MANRTGRLEGHVREKLFNTGKTRHDARSFRKRFRIVVGRTTGKYFV